MEPNLLQLHAVEDADCITLSLIGELDVSTAPELIERLAEAVQERPARVDVDLTRLSYTDSVGFSVFVTAHFQCRDAGIELRFVDPNPFLSQLLATTGLVEVLTIVATDVLVGT